MSKEIKSCANIIKCIGTISEFNLEFYQKEDNVVVRGSVVLLVNDSYIRFNIFTNKKQSEQYYSLLETIGIPYHFIQSIDKDNYELDKSVQAITVGMCGSVKIVKDKQVLKQVNLKQSTNPTTLFIRSNLTEYGNQSTYINRADNKAKCGISISLQGIMYKWDKDSYGYANIIIPTDSDIKIIKIRCLQDITVGKLYDFQLEWNKGYEINDNIISNVESSGFQIVGRKELDYQYDEYALRNMIKIYEIKHST
jgi:hypothetical protein